MINVHSTGEMREMYFMTRKLVHDAKGQWKYME